MDVFVTGATGWVGSALVKRLLAAGHQVTALARSGDKAAPLRDRGAMIVKGTLDDLDLLARSAGEADAVAHTAFNFDPARFAASAGQDERAIAAMGKPLAGTHKPLLVTSGLAGLASGRLATEDDRPDPASVRRSEAAAQALAGAGVRASTVRLAPSVHGAGETHGFVPMLIRIARETGVSAYIGDGANRWAGVHRGDAARLYLLALEKGNPLSVYHAVADEGVAFRQIAEVIGRRLNLPVESRDADHFGWFARFAGGNMAASAAATIAATGWTPSGPGLLADIASDGAVSLTRTGLHTMHFSL